MADFIIAKWHEISSEAIRERGYFAVALSGGKTPVPLYRKLAKEQGEIMPWDKTHVFLVDERFVALTDSDSNYRMIRETLLDAVPIPSGNVHFVQTGLADPVEAAGRYGADLAGFFRLPKGIFPEFDLILLGLGEDGHTASLFPGSPTLNEKKRLVSAVILGGEMHNRITLTLPVLNNARNVFFCVTGKVKARVLRDVVEKRRASFPASLVSPERGRLLFLADAEAGGLLL
jgi:6-phosphogluconolactonase